MKKFLNPKIILPSLTSTAFVGLVLYILVAPATWWKPFYIRIESDETPTPAAAHAETQPQTAEHGSTQHAAPASTGSHATTPPAPPMGYLPGTRTASVMYELDTKVVNLAEPGGLRYLQTSIVLEIWPLIEDYYHLEGEERALAEEHFRETIDARRPVIDDIVTTLMSSKTFNEIATIEGKQTLKQELMAAINDTLGYQGVINVYFTDFVVQ